jgi:cobalt-zinc-cadmium efflux system outer membrane protein
MKMKQSVLTRSIAPLVALLCAGSSAFACPDLSRDAAARLTVAAVLDRVALCHPDVRAADQALAAAAADLITAGQGQNPQLTVGAGSVDHNNVGNGSIWRKTFDHEVRIDQLIERGGKPALRRAAAEAVLDAVRADRAEALRQARLSAQRMFLDLAAATARRTETTATVRLNAESLANIERRVKAGDAAALDATRFGLDAIRVQADLEQTDADTRALRLQLATAIGAEAVADAIAPALPMPAPVLAAPTVDAGVIERRPDVLAARRRVAGAEQAYQLAQAQRTRDVTVGVQYDHYPTSLANSNGNGNTVSLSVSVPLFLRHGYGGEIARAEADLRAAQEVLRKVQLAADMDLARARSQWAAASARYRLAAEQLAPAAEKVAAGAELAYRRGASPILDVLDARRSLRAAHIERINAEAELAKATAELEAAARPIDATTP